MDRCEGTRMDEAARRHGALFLTPLGGRPFVPQRRAVTHDHVVLLFYTAGAVEIELQQLLRLGGGDVLLLPAGEPHRLVRAEGVEGWGLGFCPSCFMRTELAELLAPFERVRMGAAAALQLATERRPHMQRLFEELARESSRGGEPAHALVERSLFALILAELARATIPPAVTASRPPLVAAALNYIERHCFAPISLRDVAAAIGRSPAHVTTALRQATGRTAQAWIIAGRLAEARRRLIATDESVEDIAGRVGYADASHFIRLFRREHAMPPAAWRALHRR
ncbi:AraC family transcriptional regulator [Nannocystis radixulma]|uniref:AraC family transcriptional regulator n=1 Tax=Nannocystis radixulma TaxID=2995305 RepID=A0ABT5AYH9_9BACT|nr:AraC family transcriptional regulator [Nannocystis radixulma]MDC0666329.1 AraC family transcriptional regulator [Nannocystis radixulma]